MATETGIAKELGIAPKPVRVAKFGANSKLHMYLSEECQNMIIISHDSYTMPLILTALFHVIACKKLFDPRNQECIICDSGLEDSRGFGYFENHGGIKS